MDKTDVILWVVSGGFSLMLIMWHMMNNKIEKSEASLSKRIDDVQSNLSKKIDDVESNLTKRMDGLEVKIGSLEKDVQSLNTRMAVVESKLGDVSTNVTHLMWQHQAIHHKDAEEQ